MPTFSFLKPSRQGAVFVSVSGPSTIRLVQSLGLVSRINVLTAIRDHDLQGAKQFAEALGFEGPAEDLLVERGRRYDARAVLAYAHGKATGDYLTPDQIPVGATKVLTDLGFTVATRTDLDRPKAAPSRRTRSASVPRTSTARGKPEPVVRLCETCFTQLSVTGVCDFCD